MGHTQEQKGIYIVTGADTLEVGPFPKLTGQAPILKCDATTLGNLFGKNDYNLGI